MAVERCSNQNHSKMNVTVRYCLACGEIVNRKIPNQHCDEADHAKKRKECGQQEQDEQRCLEIGDNVFLVFAFLPK